MITAYVLITVPAKHSGGVVEELQKYDAVKEAAAVYGETDVIAKIQAESLVEIDQLVMEKIQANSSVSVTRTFLAIKDLSWER